MYKILHVICIKRIHVHSPAAVFLSAHTHAFGFIVVVADVAKYLVCSVNKPLTASASF